MAGRMLLSHNFDVTPGTVPTLSRAEFAAVFQVGLQGQADLLCRPIDHPHWIVEIRFPQERLTAAQVGAFCGQALADTRRSHCPDPLIPSILLLGGLKTTPPTGNSPTALQPGEWGVDVVETPSSESFLEKIAWGSTVAQRPADSIFKVEISNPEP